MTLFNKAPFIARTLASVREQSLPPGEVIVVDDGSSDAGPEIVAQQFPEMTLIRTSNQGVGAARNVGLRAATADWVALLDGDDIWSPDHLSEIRTAISVVPTARMVGTAHVRATEDELRQQVPSWKPANRRGAIAYFLAASRDIGVIWTSTTALHRRTALEAGGFGPWRAGDGEDLELWARIALEHPVGYSDAVTAFHVQDTGGAMHQQDVQRRAWNTRPSSIGEISPACLTVSSALLRGDHRPPTVHLQRYLDSRIRAAARGRIVWGEIEEARAIQSLTLRPWAPENLPISLLAALPPKVLQSALSVQRALRRGLTTVSAR